MPVKGSKNDGDLSDISIRITGPRAWSGLSRSHIVRGASELINSPNLATPLFRALHTANISGVNSPLKLRHVIKEVEALRK